MYNNGWDAFFGNPLIRTYLEEAADRAKPLLIEEAAADLEQLAADLEQGTIDQDDLISMYKAGKISKDEIQQIVSTVEGNGEEEAPVDPETGEPQLSEEELLAQQIDQTNDLFVKFNIYDKIAELNDKLTYFKDNFEDIQSELYERVIQLKEFLNVLSNLVFNLETAVSYQMYGSILLQLTELFQEYNEQLEAKRKYDVADDMAKEPYRDGDLPADPVDAWADKNKSHLMPDNDIGQDHGIESNNKM
jgi:exonuclease VII small subunit